MSYQITLAQISPTLGDLDRNAALHRAVLDDAITAGSDLVVFPELSLTGYFAKDLVDEIALGLDDPRLDTFRQASSQIDIVVGLILADRGQLLHVASVYFARGEVVHVHRKAYLPTYGMFEEARFLAPGNALRAFDTRLGRMAILICEDVWHPSSVGVVCADGADVLLVVAASPARGFDSDRPASARVYEDMNRLYAELFGIHVVFCNRVGFEDGIGFWGGSEAIDPFGVRLAKAPYFETAQVTVSIDPAAQRRARLVTPLWRDERLDLTHTELSRIIGERREAGR